MAKGAAIGLILFGTFMSVGLLFLEWKHQPTMLQSSMKIQQKLTKPPKHPLYYIFKIFEWLLLGLTWGILFLTLYFEFNKSNSWKLLLFSWALSFKIDGIRLFLKTAKPLFFDNTMAASNCECYFGAASWYAGFVVMFWVIFYKDVLADRDFLQDSQKLIVKIVISILVLLGIFARFFFGLETYNQILIGVGLALAFIGLSLFDEFWENQFAQIFNSDSSKCVARWLAFFIWIVTAAYMTFLYFVAKKNVSTFERGVPKAYQHPFAKSTCKSQCFVSGGKPAYLSYNSYVSIAWFLFVPLMFLYCSLTSSVKYSNSQLYMIKYLAQFKDTKVLVIKLILLVLLNAPIIASAWYSIKGNWMHDLAFKIGMAVLWLIIYRWINPIIKKNTETFTKSDMFAPWMEGDDEQKEGLI